MKLYNTHMRMSSRQDRLIKHLLSIGVLDYENSKLIQHRIVPYACRHEGTRWRSHPDLPGCVIIDEPFNPKTWEDCPLGV